MLPAPVVCMFLPHWRKEELKIVIASYEGFSFRDERDISSGSDDLFPTFVLQCMNCRMHVYQGKYKEISWSNSNSSFLPMKHNSLLKCGVWHVDVTHYQIKENYSIRKF